LQLLQQAPFRQRHLSKSLTWIWSKGKDLWPYKLDEIIDLLKHTELTHVLHLEGEKSVEIARSDGIAAFSLRGSKEDKLKALAQFPSSPLRAGGLPLFISLTTMKQE
jgi:hypothetical protein